MTHNEEECQIQSDLFKKAAEQVVIRSLFVNDAYIGIVTTFTSVALPIYLVAVRYLIDNNEIRWISLEALPVWLLLASMLISLAVRFPRYQMIDFKQPARTFEAQLNRSRKMRFWVKLATLSAVTGLVLSIYVLMGVST
jgi:hypothetical protein